MSTLVISILSFIVTLGILVTIHEFGHFWVARTLGVKVLRFSVGFGKPIWSRRAGPDNTEYVLAAIPLGGYVKMLDEHEGEVAPHELPRAFNRQKLPTRFAIVLAGPLFNFLFAILAYWLIFTIGVEALKPVVGEVAVGSIAAEAGLKQGDEIVAIAGKPVQTWEAAVFGLLDKILERGQVAVAVRDEQGGTRTIQFDIKADGSGLDRGSVLENLGIRPVRLHLPAVIGQIEPGGAAAQAGLAVGDSILSADGQEITDWAAWVDYVRARPGRMIAVGVERAGQRLQLQVQPAATPSPNGEIGRIGAAAAMPALPTELRVRVQYDPLEAVGQAMVKSWEISALTLSMLGKMVIGQASLENVSGPLSIAQYAGYSASDGLVSFLRFLAIISISLGVLNLLPIPLLDGGHLMYYLIEAVKGSPVSAKAQLIGQQLGIALLAGLTILAVYNDLTRLFGAHS
ncbi:MAG TPA: RIP metalloprotease RseP [Gammaproteobacteria bacterium]|nr:RIP metalloprotease RseP [Gammaproteobacteria bacterium]